ncbi:hypothetical protein C0J45_5824 [Silurus meridionalis]|nr:hypothetical protein C0J45_5824 [Silurus meridionalis]
MPRSKEIQKQIRKKVIEIYQSGKGYKVISKALGLQQTTMRAIIHKWQKHGSGDPSQELPAEQNNPKSTATTHPRGYKKPQNKIQRTAGLTSSVKTNINELTLSPLPPVPTPEFAAGKELLIIFEEEAEQWASYMHSILARSVPEMGICCYNIAMVSSRRDNFLELNGYKCKLLILSRGMLEGMCQLHRFFLARVLRPEACVVVLLCGVDSLEPLLELVPLKGEECLQISSDQDAQEYHSAVLDIIQGGESNTQLGSKRKEKFMTENLLKICKVESMVKRVSKVVIKLKKKE